MNKKMHMIAFLLVIVGGVNWGLVGLLGFDLVQWLFVDTLNIEILATIVYILVGLSAVYLVATHKKNCVHCGASKESHSAPADDM